jgi:hypothetical protein
MKANNGGPIIFVFDEVDDLINYESKNNRLLLGLLKKSLLWETHA